MEKNWFQRNPGITVIIAFVAIWGFGKALSLLPLASSSPEFEWVALFISGLAEILVMRWALIQKRRSFWWLLLIIPIPVAYFFLDNNSEMPQSTKPKIDSTKSPSKEEIIEKWKGTPGMDHIRKK